MLANTVGVCVCVCVCVCVDISGAQHSLLFHGCSTLSATSDECESYNHKSYQTHGDFIGVACVCNGDLCNSATRVSAGRLTVSFTVASLLALAAARVLAG